MLPPGRLGAVSTSQFPDLQHVSRLGVRQAQRARMIRSRPFEKLREPHGTTDDRRSSRDFARVATRVTPKTRRAGRPFGRPALRRGATSVLRPTYGQVVGGTWDCGRHLRESVDAAAARVLDRATDTRRPCWRAGSTRRSPWDRGGRRSRLRRRHPARPGAPPRLRAPRRRPSRTAPATS